MACAAIIVPVQYTCERSCDLCLTTYPDRKQFASYMEALLDRSVKVPLKTTAIIGEDILGSSQRPVQQVTDIDSTLQDQVTPLFCCMKFIVDLQHDALWEGIRISSFWRSAIFLIGPIGEHFNFHAQN